MSYQVLARRWRPGNFDEVVGQSHIVRSLANSVKNKRLSHAYLFSGTRGVGKTSLARILAKAIRCESLVNECNPCGKCLTCEDTVSGSSMDVIEIDGASFTSTNSRM